MSTQIEQRVVEMQFDNKQFEQNVSTTMSSLDKLKQSLNLSGAAKGLESVGTAAKGINLSGLTTAAETVSLKFNAMWTIADQALRDITNTAFYAGKRIVSALTIDPIKTGFAEYETQINSVQTILANTKSKGTTIEDVNSALDELNTYADKTIYNFTEMTKNIGRFTAAGVDLDTSVGAIKGIANLAAVSGSSSQQASAAMYQLSQALAAGKVNLMDWNSVVNAGMGGELFQNALKRTAEVMNGTDVDAIIKKCGSFRESLSKGDWLTTDVLSETLNQLSGAYSEADLLAKGYTKSQAKEILDLAKTAEGAATDVKTLTQLWDTLKESAQSGWAQTWEIIVGDFEEAKALFSAVSKVVGGMIGDSAKARNELLQAWKDAGGRADLIEGFKNAFNGLVNIIKPIKEAFREIFPATTAWQLVKFTQGFKNLTASFAEFTAIHGDKIHSTFKGIFAVIDIGWTFVKKLAGGIVDLLGHFTGLGGGILDVTGKIGEWLTGLRDTVKQTDIFGIAIDKVVGFVGKIITVLKKFGTMVGGVFNAANFEGFLAFFESLWDVIVKIGSKIGQIFAPLITSITELFRGDTFMDALNGGIFTAILVGVAHFVRQLSKIVEPIRNFLEQLGGRFLGTGRITQMLDSVRGCFEAWQNSVNAEALKKIATAIVILAGAIFILASIDAASMDSSLGAITVLFTELMASLAIFTKLDFGGKGMIKGVSAINGLATALLTLSIGMKIMSTISWSEIGVGIVGTVVGLGALVAAVNLLPEKNVKKSAKAIGKLATALVILSVGMKIMSSLSWQEMGIAITGVVAGLGALVAAVNLLPKDAGARTLGVIGLATAMVILGGALKIMGSMSWNEIGQGLAAMAGSLAAIVLAMNFMPNDMALRSMGMIGLATAMVILGAALKSMGGMTWEEIGRGLAVMGGALVELAIALNFMNGAIAGAGALIIAATALAILAPVLASLGGMTWGEIAKGLVALAGAFAVIGVAGLLLTPLVPTLLSLAGAMALFGVAAIAIGAGVAAIAWAFTALAAAGATGATAFVAALGALTVGILGLIPSIALVIGDMIVALCDVIIAVAPKLAETLLVLVTEALSMLVTYIPQIVSLLLQFFIAVIDALAANIPQLITSAVNLIGAFFQGVVDALGGLDTSSLLKGIVGVGLMTAMAYALSGVLAILPGAMAGIIGMGVLIAELALVLAAVGALAQIPGLSWLIGEGGNLLQQIGTAIGQFVGGIVGGIAEGATSTLPQVGTNLANFMTNIQPFVDGMAGIDASVLDNATTLAGAILALTAADLLSGIASFFKGGTSLADFGTEIASFGTAMKDYADAVADIDVASITVSVAAAQGLVTVARLIPDDGAFGTDGIDNFGDNIVDFAKSMKKYAKQVSGISIESINNSVSAVQSLVSVINSMVGMDSSGVKSFTKAIKDLSKVNLNDVVNTFAASTTKFTDAGKNMFNAIIDGANSAKAKFISTAQAVIADGLEAIDSKTGRFKIAGTEIMTKFVNGILESKDKVSNAFESALSSALTDIESYQSRFNVAGGYLVSGLANGISANSYKAAAQARVMARAAARAAEDELDIHSPSRVGYGIGDFFGIGFINAIADNVRNAYNASAEMANSAKTGLMNAFDKVSRIISGDLEVQPTISPVVDLTNVKSSVNAINGMLGLRPSMGVLTQVNAVNSMMNQHSQNGSADEIVSAINKLQKALGNVGGTTNNIINGVTYDDGSAINEAVRVITRAALIEGRA